MLDIPSYPPIVVVAQSIFEAFQAEVRLLKTSLNQARKATAQFRRETHPQTIFQDVRRPAALPVETLLEHRETKVVDVDAVDQSVTLEPPIEFVPDLPILISGHPDRWWASLQARMLLDSANAWADPGIYGNRKGHQAAHLWKAIVHQIETAYSNGTTLSGLTADIEKAFNCIPGTPFSTMTA